MRPAAKREGGHGAMPSPPIGRKIYIFKRLDEIIFLNTYATTPKKIINKKKGYLYFVDFFDDLLFIFFVFAHCSLSGFVNK